MPVRIPEKLPAVSILKEENIFVMDSARAHNQDIRPLKIVVLNLMPIKVTTETDLIRLLSNTPLQVDLTLMKLESHTSKNTPVEHMMAFYRPFSELEKEKFDGMIITGAPVENFAFEDVNYWEEVTRIFSWARKNVYSTLYICWAAQAGLYYHYGIDKHPLKQKMFGVFEHTCTPIPEPIFRGFDDSFFMPHSRHTEIWRKDVLGNPKLTLLAEAEESGVGIVMARQGREFFVTGHMEYSPLTLHNEYMRDLGKRDDVGLPQHYYPNDDCTREPIVRWRAHANLFYHNWINYYVYQQTPYNINEINEN
ncbi:MAG: homoserine O-succinyltransferase [Bacteroidaceae bacterium]|nr:homoserine O-succinyltransferase [Bacteroidaceae bacterium]